MITIDSLLNKLAKQEAVSFSDSIAVINSYYAYRPTRFSNGDIINEAGTNEGSCKIFAFAQLHQLTEQQTLNLFGDYYHIDVLKHPGGTNHQNIRNFMRYGWEGIEFDDNPLLKK